jgi:hypothetical protein
VPLHEGLVIAADIAFASPPVSDTSILHLHSEEADLRPSVGPWMQPEFRVGPLRAAVFERLPVGQRVHLAATYDGETAQLFVDGEEVAQTEAAERDDIPEELSGIMTLGKSQNAGLRYETHPLGVFNGMIDGLRLHLGTAEPIRPPAGPTSRIPCFSAKVSGICITRPIRTARSGKRSSGGILHPITSSIGSRACPR